MGLAMLRTTQIQEKWKRKLSKAMNEEHDRGLGSSSRRYALFILPLITVLREGLEAIVFIGGVTFTETAKAIPAAVIAGFLCGLLIGYILYRGGNKMNLHKFFTASTCLLLLLAAGLVAKGVAAFESYAWNKATNAQSDDSGTYDPRINVWALSCCDPHNNDAGFAQLMNALFGWSNVASVGSVVCYIGYWLIVIVALVYMKLKQRREAVLAALEAPEETKVQEKKAAHLDENGSSGSNSRTDSIKDIHAVDLKEL
ncbi:high-affinity iron permease [Mortierella sp. NVP85]|nr:high-affinity iron permease [Mortierella sp. NVP85]